MYKHLLFSIFLLFTFALEAQQPKIVGLVPVRNEERIIAQCLLTLSHYCDAIVVLDDASTDNTAFIVESLASICHVEKIIKKKEWFRDEPADRNALLHAGRAIGGTHFIVIDADEMFTANCSENNFLRNKILALKPGEVLALNWIQLWRTVDQYRCDRSVWTNNYKDFIFCDNGTCQYQSDFIHTKRTPAGLQNVTCLYGYTYGMMHFQFVNWRNLLVKQAWYRCLEHIRNPSKSTQEINALYAPSKDECDLGVKASPPEWFANYPFFDRHIYSHPEQWREEQVIEWFTQYGKDYFKDLDIWDVEWKTTPKEGIVNLLSDPSNQKIPSKINLVWQGNKWEQDWLMELLAGIDLNIIDDGKYEKYLDNSIIIVSLNTPTSPCEAYFQKLHDLKYKFGVIVLSDEWYSAPSHFYPHAQFVFRNYWNKKFSDQSNVMMFPLGYKSGFWKNAEKKLKLAEQRSYTWSFAGQIDKKATRQQMVDQLTQFPKHCIFKTASFNDPSGLSVEAYRNLLLDTIFAPCPRGFWNLDSFRVYEALECGCIPIVEKTPLDYFTNFYGEHPFLSVETWDQAPELMKALLSDQEQLEKRRRQCVEWWQEHKKKVAAEFSKRIVSTLLKAQLDS